MKDIKRQENRFRLTGSLVAKVTAFLLMLFSAALCAAGAAGSYAAYEERMYSFSFETVMNNILKEQAHGIAYEMYHYLNTDNDELARLYLDDINAEVAVIRYADRFASDSSVFIWQSYEAAEATGAEGFYSDLYEDIGMELPAFAERQAEETGEPKEMIYIIRVFCDPALPKEDNLKAVAQMAGFIYRMRYLMIWGCVCGALLFIICFIFLLCSAGHRNGRDGIVPGLLTKVPLDLLTGCAGLGIFLLLQMMVELSYHFSDIGVVVGGIALCMTLPTLGMIYLCDFAIRLKMGGLWRNTVIYRLLGLLRRGLRFLWKGVRRLMGLLLQAPMVLNTTVAYWGICIVEAFLFIGCFASRAYRGEVFLGLWALEKLAVFLGVLCIALTYRKLLKAGRELAAGHEDYRVDTRQMFWIFKEHGENLNSLGQGVTRAVAERMKSERLKTELITNVSHDLKTPLTSIINYAELISLEAKGNPEENPAICEYSEVLLRQSGRLKRLLENLVEASKAATGNLEVKPEPCEAGVFLSQAAGEYQKRLEEKSLELRVSQPEEPVRILADGRHLWRVFDNLLSNICKYAQEGSRVYLTLEQKEKKAFIIFRNMSKYALDISPEELEERFVRGDKSRHMEGNGLGLSIAKSLTELQQGQMEIVVDGDLFKVVLTFDAID
ncbi:MAG: sensor histidine kinase [Butyrivibrio sp.]|nr:sensor histidine kinase [Acetatifactor muris]MCM1559998.1 sensor histidine kinase [Butyrivibrio sp.]